MTDFWCSFSCSECGYESKYGTCAEQIADLIIHAHETGHTHHIGENL